MDIDLDVRRTTRARLARPTVPSPPATGTSPAVAPAAAPARVPGGDALGALLQRAVLQRQTGTEMAPPEPRIVEDDEGEFELPPLNLMDFVAHALAEGGRADRRRRRRGPQGPDPAVAERQERERRAAEDQQRLEAEQREKERLAAEEKARREAELEQERLRLEAEEQERLRLEAEEQKRLLREAQKLEREKKAAEELQRWTTGLAKIATDLAQAVQTHIGATLWALLTPVEQAQAVQEAAAVANEPIATKTQIEQGIKKRRKKNKSAPVELDAVLDQVRANIEDSVMKTAAQWRASADTRRTQQIEAAALAVPVTTSELSSLVTMPSGPAWPVFYRALHQNKIQFIHASSYRTVHERQEKKGNQHGPFSREFYVRILGTRPANPSYYLQANWVVHVHYKTSAEPLVAEYLHLKPWDKRGVPINHVINKKLETTLDAPTRNAVSADVDQASTRM